MADIDQARAGPDSLDAGLSWPVVSCVFAAALSSLNFGWTLGEPNIPEDTIKDCIKGPEVDIHGLPTCLPMSSVMCGVASTVVATYNSECAPPRVRGFAGAVLQLSVEVGVFLSQLAAILLADVPNWRILFSLSAGLSIAQLLWLPFMPESPKFLVSRGRLDEAERALRLLRPGSDVARELAAMVEASHGCSADHPAANEAGFVTDVDSECKIADDDCDSTAATPRGASAVSVAQRTARGHTVGIADILRGRTPDVLWHPLFCTLFLMGFQQWTGAKGVVFYSTEIVVGVLNLTRSQVQHTPNSAQWVTIGITATGIICVVASMLLIDRLGRRRLLLVSTGGLVVACALVVVGCTCNAPALSIVAMFALKAAYCLGMAPIPWLCASEMLPYYALGALSGVACALNWLMIFAIGLLFPVLSKVLGGYLFLPFACLNAAAFSVVLLFVPETKGHRVCDIIQHHGRRVHIVLTARRSRRNTST